MKYKVGDRVRIKSLDWYNKSDRYGHVYLIGWFNFIKPMADFCGKIVTIKEVQSPYNYRIFEDGGIHYYTDEMIEGLVEEETKPNIIEEAKTYWDSIKDAWICPEGYIFKDENGNVINATKIVLEKKKKEYPKTYEECLSVLGIYNGIPDVEIYNAKPSECKLFESLIRLKRCRDAYWKIAGEEMGLGKPWEPDWLDDDVVKHIISHDGKTYGTRGGLNYINYILTFPTEEMRDAFYENFKEEIESCKELL